MGSLLEAARYGRCARMPAAVPLCRSQPRAGQARLQGACRILTAGGCPPKVSARRPLRVPSAACAQAVSVSQGDRVQLRPRAADGACAERRIASRPQSAGGVPACGRGHGRAAAVSPSLKQEPALRLAPAAQPRKRLNRQHFWAALRPGPPPGVAGPRPSCPIAGCRLWPARNLQLSRRVHVRPSFNRHTTVSWG